MSINDLFTDAARQLLGDQCTPDVVRAIEQVLGHGPRTPDMGGGASTTEVGMAVAELLK